MSVSDAERAFYESILSDPEGKSLADLRYAYFLGLADGAIPYVNTDDLSEGDVLAWDADTGTWVPQIGGGGFDPTAIAGWDPDHIQVLSHDGDGTLSWVASDPAFSIPNGGAAPADAPDGAVIVEEEA